MNYINDNRKWMGVLTFLLITTAVVLELIGIFDSKTVLIDYPIYISSIVTLEFGFIYAFYGYKKDAAKYYKGFMRLLLLAFLLNIAGEIVTLNSSERSLSMIPVYADFIRFILLFPLVFILDLGKRKSLIFSYGISVLSLFIFVIALVSYADSFGYIVMTSGHLVLSLITSVFVNAKYKDKASRGSK